MSKRHEEIETQKPTMVIESLDHLYRLLVADQSIDHTETVWEQEPLMEMAHKGKLSAYKHSGFWQCMDTLRDRNLLESLWQSKKAPWKVWK